MKIFNVWDRIDSNSKLTVADNYLQAQATERIIKSHKVQSIKNKWSSYWYDEELSNTKKPSKA